MPIARRATRSELGPVGDLFEALVCAHVQRGLLPLALTNPIHTSKLRSVFQSAQAKAEPLARFDLAAMLPIVGRVAPRIDAIASESLSGLFFVCKSLSLPLCALAVPWPLWWLVPVRYSHGHLLSGAAAFFESYLCHPMLIVMQPVLFNHLK